MSPTAELDSQAVEKELRQLPGVVAVRVATNEAEVSAVDLVVLPGVETSHISDAVRKQLQERFALAVPPESVGVTMLPGTQIPAAAGAAEAATPAGGGAGGRRVRIEHVAVQAKELRAEATVSLFWAGQQWSGVREGPNTSRRRWRLIAEATLAGLEEILAEPGLFSLEELRVVDMLDEQIAVVAIELTARRRGQRLTGACSAAASHGSVDEAVVRATLQAVNRLFGSFVSPAQHNA